MQRAVRGELDQARVLRLRKECPEIVTLALLAEAKRIAERGAPSLRFSRDAMDERWKLHSDAVVQNLWVPSCGTREVRQQVGFPRFLKGRVMIQKRTQQIERRMDRIKEELQKIGRLRPGLLTRRYRDPEQGIGPLAASDGGQVAKPEALAERRAAPPIRTSLTKPQCVSRA